MIRVHNDSLNDSETVNEPTLGFITNVLMLSHTGRAQRCQQSRVVCMVLDNTGAMTCFLLAREVDNYIAFPGGQLSKMDRAPTLVFENGFSLAHRHSWI